MPWACCDRPKCRWRWFMTNTANSPGARPRARARRGRLWRPGRAGPPLRPRGALGSAEVPLALVHDEYGHLDGIVTPGSILAALAGAFAHDVEQGEEPPLVEREDGSWLVSGAASADLLS